MLEKKLIEHEDAGKQPLLLVAYAGQFNIGDMIPILHVHVFVHTYMYMYNSYNDNSGRKPFRIGKSGLPKIEGG